MAESKRYLDLVGLGQFWAKVKEKYAAADAAVAQTAANELATARTALEGQIDGVKKEAANNLSTVEHSLTAVINQTGQMLSDLNASLEVGIPKMQGAIDANTEAIAVLNGEGDGSVKKQVADAIAAVVADANEDFDTLKEVADWILNDTTGAAAMQNAIATLTGDVTKEGSVAYAVKAEETRATGVEAGLQEAINTKVAQTDYDTKVGELETAIDALEAIVGGGEGENSVVERIEALEAADTAIRGEFATADTQIRTDFAEADKLKVDKTTYATDKAAIQEAIDAKVAQTAYDLKVKELADAITAGDNLKVDKTDYNDKVKELEEADTAMKARLTTLEEFAAVDYVTEAEWESRALTESEILGVFTEA